MAKKVRITSPKGIAQYPWLIKPSTKFKPDGEYQCTLLLDPEDVDVKDFISKIDGYVEEAYQLAINNPDNKKYLKQGIGKHYPYQMETDDEGEETGKLAVKFKKAATFKDKDSGEIVKVVLNFFNTKGAPCTPTSIFGGSLLRINANVGPWFSAKDKEAGVTLYINAVQVIKANDNDASSYGFGDEGGEEEEEQGGADVGQTEGEENPDF